jgi:hypothetical protein
MPINSRSSSAQLFIVGFVLAASLSCGGVEGRSSLNYDPGKLWVRPDPAILTLGAQLVLQAVPEVHSEAPYIQSVTWAVMETGGGTLQVLGSYGEFARFTAPATSGIFHVKATTEFGTTRYVPQPGTIQVIEPASVGVSVSPTLFVIKRDYTGNAPKPFASVTPLSNRKVQWSVVEAGYEGPDLIYLVPDESINSCLILWNGSASIDRLPGNLFHVRVQSAEVPTAFTLVEVQIQR